jgi:hypothetical protein
VRVEVCGDPQLRVPQELRDFDELDAFRDQEAGG